jgi:hypothetical protein
MAYLTGADYNLPRWPLALHPFDPDHYTVLELSLLTFCSDIPDKAFLYLQLIHL